MIRFLLALPFVFSISAGWAQNNDACARDVTRFCRAHMSDGDSMVILACLKQNRARLSKGCAKVLTDHGQ